MLQPKTYTSCHGQADSIPTQKFNFLLFFCYIWYYDLQACFECLYLTLLCKTLLGLSYLGFVFLEVLVFCFLFVNNVDLCVIVFGQLCFRIFT